MAGFAVATAFGCLSAIVVSWVLFRRTSIDNMASTTSENERLSKTDPNSFSRPTEWVTEHIHLKLTPDFETSTLSGWVHLKLQRKDGSSALLLDTRDLTIKKVVDLKTKAELKYTVGEVVGAFGSCLNISLPNKDEASLSIGVEYSTSPKCSALQWMKPEQTLGKKHPYLFSQCQAIHCRSLLPCQDSPSVKASYSAEISAASELEVLMSAVKKETTPHQESPGLRVHHFDQQVPMPSYLIAIVVGCLEKRKIGPRSHVWCEAGMVDDAAYEFAQTEDMIAAAEGLLGAYEWGVYDLLVLPPSFPYGGMENPCLTFVTPTLLAGDRSLADVIAHEIAHSWTGNLVTNSNWEHFWLNEGFTKCVERKIVGALQGEESRQMSAISGWSALQLQIDHMGADNALTKLVPDLTGVDPDDAFSIVPYEKGHTLLMYLEQSLGGAEVFDKFLRSYIQKFRKQSITTDEWKAYLYEYFKDKKAVLDGVDWEAWLYKPGMPVVKPKYDDSLLVACQELAERWSSAPEDGLGSFSGDDITNLTANQKREFLVALFMKDALSLTKIRRMEEVYRFNSVKNAEIRCKWVRLCLKARWEDVIPLAIDFVTVQGRMKFTRPVYRDLYEWPVSRDRAVENFKAHRAEMHSTTAGLVAKDLGLA